MRIIRLIMYMLLVFNSCMIFPAAPQGKLYIQNDHPVLQFKCRYTVADEERGPLTVYKDPIYLGPVRTVSKVQVSRYGATGGIAAQYYSFPEQLQECKNQADRDWVLHITWAMSGWTIIAKAFEAPQEAPIINKPLEYFRKAAAYGAVAEPRHLLDLPADYTATQVNEQQRSLQEQISQNRGLTPVLTQQISAILQTAADYAKRLLAIPNKTSAPYQKILLAWRGKLYPEKIAAGKQLACNLFRGTAQPIANQTEYLNAIIDLMWFFYDMAVQKDQPFDEGTFIVQDTQHRVYNFLMSYIKIVNPSVTGTLNDPALKISRNQYAYSRLSSHFKFEQEHFRHYGIDVRFPGSTIAQALLPAQKSHVLFGDLGNGLIFIKLENMGIAVQSVVMHGKEFVAAQLRKMLPGVRSYLQNYVPTYIDDLVLYYVGTDDDPNYRKERIPQEVLQRSLDIVQAAHLNNDQLKRITFAFATQGIHGIYNEIRNQGSPLPQAQKTALGAYLNQLLQEGLDHQDIRYGREIIITPDELGRQCR